MHVIRDGMKLGYDDAGQGAPPIVLVHGWGADRAVLAPLAACLRRSHRVVTLDLRGFGTSDAPARYAVDDFADDVAFVLDRLGLPPAVVVGHSLGGSIVLDLAARHGARVHAAILLEPMLLAPEVLAGLQPILASVRAPDYRTSVEKLMHFLAGPGVDPDARARLAHGAGACAQLVLVAAMEGQLAFDAAAAAARVRCPLFYLGTPVRYSDLDRLRGLCPQLHSEVLAGCGHYFPLEAPDEVGARIVRFLALHP